MKKIGLLLALPVALPTLVVYSVSGNNDSKILPDSLSQQCYDETIEIVSNYYSDEFRTQISEIYSDFGSDSYDAEFVTLDMEEINREIITDFTNLYDQYHSKEDQLFILYGYNLTKLCELQYEDEAMQLPFNHSSDIDTYYNTMISSPSENTYNNFKEFVTSNKILNFADTLETISEKDIASEIHDSLSAMTISLNACTKIMDVDYATALVRYTEAMKSFSNAIDTLELYPDIQTDFTNESIENIRTLISSSLTNMENHKYQEFSSDLTKLVSIIDTLSSNTDKLIASSAAEENILLKNVPDNSEHQILNVVPNCDVSNALDVQLISYFDKFNQTYRDLGLDPNKASNTLHTKYKLGTATFLGEENTIYLWIGTAYNSYPSSIEIIGSAKKKPIDELRVNLQKEFHQKAYDRSERKFTISIPGTDLDIQVYSLYQTESNLDIYIVPHKVSDESENASHIEENDNSSSEQSDSDNTEYVTPIPETSTTSSDSSTGSGVRYR